MEQEEAFSWVLALMETMGLIKPSVAVSKSVPLQEQLPLPQNHCRVYEDEGERQWL